MLDGEVHRAAAIPRYRLIRALSQRRVYRVRIGAGKQVMFVRSPANRALGDLL